METTSEVLRQSPIWVLRFIYADMLHYAYRLADVHAKDLEAISDELTFLAQFEDVHVRQILQHLNYTLTCVHSYAEANYVEEEVMKAGHEGYQQALSTWKNVTQSFTESLPNYESLVTSYSDKNQMYCIALWNCAYQLLYNEKNVYNKTFEKFLDCLEELTSGNATFGDLRTQPLFQLISQIGNFQIIYAEDIDPS